MKKFLIGVFYFLIFILGISNCEALEMGRVIGTGGLNVRTGPGTNYKTYSTLSYNDNITIMNTSLFASRQGCLSGWYQVNYNGYIRYVCSSGITLSHSTVRTNNKNGVLYNTTTNSSHYKDKVNNVMLSVTDNKKYKTSFCPKGLYKVNYNGLTKYVCSSNVSYYNSYSNLIVTSNKVNIYSSIVNRKVVASSKYNQSFTLYDNKVYKYKNNKYYAVYYRGKKRYVKTEDVLKTNYNSLVTNKIGVNIRKNPTTKSKKLTSVKYGSYLSLVSTKKYSGSGCSSGYYKVKLNKRYAYVCSSYVSTSPITTYTNRQTNIYSSASQKYRITYLEKDKKLNLISTKKYEGKNCKDGYYLVSINGRKGYVCSTNTKLQNEYATKIPILTFHRIVSDRLKNSRYSNDEWVHSYDVFKSQIKYLHDNNYKTINLDEFYCWYKGKCNFPKKTVVITFDDGNLDDYYLVMPLLKKYGFKGTTFVVGSRIKNKEFGSYNENMRAYISQDIIDKSKKEYPNHDFQSHSYNFHFCDSDGSQHIKNMTKNEIRRDFSLNSKYNFKYIAYPYGAYTKDLQDVAKENNYLLGIRFGPSNYATRKSPTYAIPRIKINGFSNVETMKQYLFY